MQLATGEVIVIMDSDLQDDPSHIHELYSAYTQQKVDVVYTKRKNRKSSFIKYLSSKVYNLLFSVFSDKNYDLDVGTMILFSARVKDEFNKLKDKDRLYIQLIKWVGFASTSITVEHNERYEGRSSYTISKLLLLALQGWTSHSDKLLRLSVYTGFFLSFCTFLTGLIVAFLYFYKGFQPGWPSLFLVILFSTGLILMSIGIVGIYIGKIFEQVKTFCKEIMRQSTDRQEEIPSYLGKLTQAPLLGAEEELALTSAAQQGDEKARLRLIESNMRLVINIAKSCRTRSVPIEDLIQEGAIGLMHTVDRFDPSKGFRFSTYATHWIRQSIGRALDNKSKAIRLPAHVSQSLRKIERERHRLMRELGHDPTHEELATELDVSPRKLTLLLQSSMDMLQLDMRIGEGDSTTLGALYRRGPAQWAWCPRALSPRRPMRRVSTSTVDTPTPSSLSCMHGLRHR